MSTFASKAKPGWARGVYLSVVVLLAVNRPCLAQAASADMAASSPITAPQCSPVLLDCNAPVLPTAHDRKLLDSATASDQAQRAKMQADQAQAEQDLQRRIEFARKHPNAIFVFGNRQQTPQESVRDAFARVLGKPLTTLTVSTFDSMGRRTECVSACYGPMCCVTTAAASDYRR